ncbi:serine/threonine-protein kinase [Kribbella voronezhensis]|uniref:non-specific serine/threonine protein kinase n=1 Tax=Kribbella voronezhensis TaxID=2512212 RepID=A0A4R7TCG9_9ACTN|nr:Stk1 family PASTA domain-containing Ser/Thr kinase [Kribbella voronezhensis]TDU89802.1 serine/threonine-protein kinase [Kribbella voronezhensis]
MTSQARLVGGRYEEGEPLGRGGMADVRKGIDNRLGRTVAIKRLRVDLASDSTFQARFRREAQSAASLNHPTIVSVYDTGEEPDPNGSGVTIPYIVMEYVAGKTLRDLIREGRKIMPERALEITSGVLEALDYSHRAGIVHRDIKPGNVMLTPQGQVKVMDFGIARAVADTSSTMTQTAAVIGTAQYLSPEQARGETVDARSDLYSTGCLLYELLVGRPPFVGESPVSVAYQHVREEPLPPSSFDPDIPPEVDAVVLKALTKNREHRYQSASEMRADIHRVLAGQQVTAPMAAIAETRAIQPTAVAPAAAATQAYRPASDLLPPDDGDDDVEAARARRNRGLAYFLLGLAIVAVAVGAYAIITNLGKKDNPPPVTQVAVPSVVGKPVAEATAIVEAKGLQVATTSAASTDVPKGSVARQQPGANAMVDKNSTVTLVVSAGPNTFPVPDVLGKSEQDARDALENAPGKFEVASKVNRADSDQPKDTVIKVSPDPSGQYAPGTKFTLTLSNGSSKVDVPDVTTQNQDDATNTLKGLGLAVGYLQDKSDPNAVEGTVVKQSVKAGSKVPKGTKVILSIAVAADQPSNTPSNTPTNTPTESNTPIIGGGGPGLPQQPSGGSSGER